MEITDDEWKTIGERIMALPGMFTECESTFISEPYREEQTYIKFMSYRGVTDDNNGQVLHNYLRANAVSFAHARLRSLAVANSDLRRLFLESKHA